MNTKDIDSVTASLVDEGHRVFQIHRFAGSDYAHVERLLSWANFSRESYIADLGCGVGEVAKIMQSIRDDLSFSLINISQVQLDIAPSGFEKICCDFCNIPKGNGSFDAAMFCFSIGHADISIAMKEASRILRKGGVLFIYDMTRAHGDNENMRTVQYAVYDRSKIEHAANESGLLLDLYLEPKDHSGYGESLFGDDFNIVFDGTIPSCWRFIKC